MNDSLAAVVRSRAACNQVAPLSACKKADRPFLAWPIPDPQSEAAVCWVCLEEATGKRHLYQPCSCPRSVHKQCLARWQLHSAGTKEEKFCRFCEAQLPDWRRVLGPPIDPNVPVHPTMSVTFNGQIHHVEVRNGEGAYDAFLTEIRRIFCITEDHDMQLAFDCADPVTGALVKLSGPGSFHAAVHCATVSAAKRMRTNMGKRRRDGRPQLDHLRVSDSANSLDLDIDTLDPFSASPSMNGSSPPIAQQAAATSLGCGAPAAAALVNNIERAAALRAAHRRSIESMLRRVLQMRAVQSEADIIATSLTRLDQLETHLRNMLHHHDTAAQ